MDNMFQVFTDGACSGNPGPGGFGVIIKQKAGSGVITKQYSVGYGLTTNNRMELMSVIFALEHIEEGSVITITTDSQYVCKAIKSGWLESWQKNGWKTSGRKPVKNKDLWLAYLNAAEGKSVRFIWVKGHAGHPENEKCDKLATAMYRDVQCEDSDLSEDSVYLVENGYKSSEEIRHVTKFQAIYLEEIGHIVPLHKIRDLT